ncbi:MAG: hypothetical protein KDK36_06420 [Leptospiraceae bacterium]|nr:hypothetical protein [Leptospiraceae bacterium]
MDFLATISLHTQGNEKHLDIFFEKEDYLLTYESSFEFLEDFLSGKPILGIKKENHRKIYLNYQGPISKNRGDLYIVWKGFYDSKMKNFSEKIFFFQKNQKIMIHIN